MKTSISALPAEKYEDTYIVVPGHIYRSVRIVVREDYSARRAVMHVRC